MKRIFFVLGAVFIAVALTRAVRTAGGPDVTDTRLLTQPAISANQIAFVYAADLWVCDLDGKNVRRLTGDLGRESNPAFSPDGSRIAFSAQYEGNTDVYVVPATGGVPRRLTWHPGADLVQGFTPDGKSVLFTSGRAVYTNRYTRLFTAPVDSSGGGIEQPLPVPHASRASYAPGGDRIASPEKGWIVENEGVPPDIEVDQTPAEVIAGRDPQLEKAIQVALDELKKNPGSKPKRPTYPVKTRHTS
jgi:tricorn protease